HPGADHEHEDAVHALYFSGDEDSGEAGEGKKEKEKTGDCHAQILRFAGHQCVAASLDSERGRTHGSAPTMPRGRPGPPQRCTGPRRKQERSEESLRHSLPYSLVRDFIEHEQTHEQRNVDDCGVQQPHGAAIGLLARGPQAHLQERQAQQQGPEQITHTGQPGDRGKQTDGNQDGRVAHNVAERGAPGGIHDREHANAGAGVILAVDPGNGEEMGELPEEKNREENPRGTADGVAGRSPADERGDSARERAHKGAPGRAGLERRIERQIGDAGTRAEQAGERVHEKEEPGLAADGERDGKHERLPRREDGRGQRASHGAAHLGIHMALEVLVHGRGAGAQQERGGNDAEQSEIVEWPAGAGAKTQAGGEHDEQGDVGFGQRPKGRGTRPGRHRNGSDGSHRSPETFLAATAVTEGGLLGPPLRIGRTASQCGPPGPQHTAVYTAARWVSRTIACCGAPASRRWQTRAKTTVPARTRAPKTVWATVSQMVMGSGWGASRVAMRDHQAAAPSRIWKPTSAWSTADIRRSAPTAAKLFRTILPTTITKASTAAAPTKWGTIPKALWRAAAPSTSWTKVTPASQRARVARGGEPGSSKDGAVNPPLHHQR